MGEFDPAAWDLFLRRMIAYNFKVFGISGSREAEAGDSAGEAAALNKLRKWNQTQNGLHAMLEFQNKLRKLGQEGREKFQFEHEMKALGDKEAKNEFNELFDDLIVDVCESTAKYSDIVKQLEALLELEKETLVIKRKVSTFSLDYDDDLASAAVLNIFNTGSSNLLDQTKCIQDKKHRIMLQTAASLASKLEQTEPITKEELQPFIDALNN